MGIDIDGIIRNAYYLGYSAMASVGAGAATYNIIDGTYLSGIVIGALTSLPLHWASDSLKNVRRYRTNREKSRELREICESFRNSYNEYSDLREEMKTIPPEAFR